MSPDMASKKAPLKLSPGTASSSGSAAAVESSSQPSVTSRNPSRGLSSRRARAVTAASAMPTAAVMAAASRKCDHRPSANHSEQPIGST